MINQINEQIEVIGESLAWIKAYRPDQYEQRFFTLVTERCKLRKIAEAQFEKPAIAAYGESQKGKSYLMGNLLQNSGTPFMVKADGQEYNFVQSINPIGDNREATGVVTRFTTFSKSEDRYSTKYPVLMKLLSATDIVTILSDGYFNDLLDYQIYPDSEIKEKAEKIYQEYKDKPNVQDILIEDDILNIKFYLMKFVKAKSQPLWKSVFFEKTSLIIRKVPKTEWGKIVSVLWHDNEFITILFNRLINCLERFSFAKEVYLPIEAVLHHGDNKNTIMSVNCLNGLYNNSHPLYCDVFVKDVNGHFTVINHFDKSELSAICAEVAYKVDEVYLKSLMHYDLEMIPVETQKKLRESDFTKDLINDSDLLDFPGARNRLESKEEFLDKVDKTDGSSNIVKILLRGKVAFLFNKYSDTKAINILMFCHDSEDVKVTKIYSVIDDWVTEYVGKNAEERKKTVELAGGVAPLFVICTKFNKDMIEKNNFESNSLSALNGRWEGRFLNVLYKDCFEAGHVDWFNNWDEEGRTFDNTYMLRDYKYSGCDGSGNNLYDGYKETDADPKEKVLKLTSSFYEQLRESFIGNTHVAKFFSDPAKAWDVAATIRNDGSLYIIERLAIVAKNMKNVRTTQFERQIKDTQRIIFKILDDYHVKVNKEDLLPQNIRKARNVHRECEFTCNCDNYYFGHLIQSLQLTDKEVYTIVHKKIQSPELIDEVNSFKDYELIRKHLENCADENTCWAKLVKIYGFDTRTEAEEYLQRRNINSNLLFSGEYKKKMNSYVIANDVYNAWISKITSTQLLNTMTGEDSFDPCVMTDLVNNIKEVADSLHVADLMANSIAEFVNVVNIHTANENLVTDLLSNEINTFITDFGYNLREDIDDLRLIASREDIPAFDYIDRERKSYYEEEELTAMFAELILNPKAITPAFDMNYNRWLEYMYISFIGKGDVIKQFDKEANDVVAAILEKLK